MKKKKQLKFGYPQDHHRRRHSLLRPQHLKNVSKAPQFNLYVYPAIQEEDCSSIVRAKGAGDGGTSNRRIHSPSVLPAAASNRRRHRCTPRASPDSRLA